MGNDRYHVYYLYTQEAYRYLLYTLNNERSKISIFHYFLKIMCIYLIIFFFPLCIFFPKNIMLCPSSENNIVLVILKIIMYRYAQYDIVTMAQYDRYRHSSTIICLMILENAFTIGNEVTSYGKNQSPHSIV